MVSLLAGLSMLLLVFDDYKLHMRRLGVVNALTSSITRAQQHGPMMATALEELKGLMRAKAAWFRLLEGDRMVIAQQIGLSKGFLQDRLSVPLDDDFERTLGGTVPVVLVTSAAAETSVPTSKQEGFHHVVMVPVLGKKSVIGTLALGSAHRLHYSPDEMEFLVTTAHQLGLAVENLRLVEQILRSHRQWTNTFDSIQDLVLLHDSDFRVMKANHALLERLDQAPADVVGQLCEAVLPHNRGQWKGCPYCGHPEEGFHEGPDPCFGGFSMVSTSSYVEQGSKQKGTIHVVRDTTDRRIAEEKYRLLFEQVQEGVFVATPEGKLLDCNDAFMRMLGYGSREELMALNVDTELYASPEQREVFRREVELHNYVRNFEVTLRRKDGTLLTAMESSFATRNAEGKIERYQGFLLDMTEKKRAEDEIRRRNRELNALNAMAVIATQSFDLDEILNLTLAPGDLAAGRGDRFDLSLRSGRNHLPPPRRMGPAQRRTRPPLRNQIHRRLRRSGDAFPHRSHHHRLFAASASAGGGVHSRRRPGFLDLGAAVGQRQAHRHHGHQQPREPRVHQQRRKPAGRHWPAIVHHDRESPALRGNLPRLRRLAPHPGTIAAERKDVGGRTVDRRSGARTEQSADRDSRLCPAAGK